MEVNKTNGVFSNKRNQQSKEIKPVQKEPSVEVSDSKECLDSMGRAFVNIQSSKIEDDMDETEAILEKLCHEKCSEYAEEYGLDYEIVRKVCYQGDYDERIALAAVKNGMSVEDAIAFANGEKSKDELNRYIKEGFSEEEAKELVQKWNSCNDEAYEKMKKLILENGANLNFSCNLVFDENKYNRFISLINNGTSINLAQALILTDAKSESQIKYISEIFDEDFIRDIKRKVQNPNLDVHIDKIFNYLSSDSESLKALMTIPPLTTDEISQSMVKFSKTSLKNAIKRPNQYLSGIPLEHTEKVNGKLPQLSEKDLEKYRNEFDKFVSRNFKPILRAEKYFDTDTINQLMDKRTDNFGGFLSQINELSSENYKLLSKLITLKNSNNEPLSAKDKIQLANIVYYFQLGKIDTRMFKKLDYIDVSELKQAILLKGLKAAGIPEKELSKCPKSRLDFDEEYSWALLSSEQNTICSEFCSLVEEVKADPSLREFFISVIEEYLETGIDTRNNGFTPENAPVYLDIMKNIDTMTEEEAVSTFRRVLTSIVFDNDCLGEIIQASVLHDFRTYITNEMNRIGRTNKKTKRAFRKNGLDYNKWLKCDYKTYKLKIKDSDYTLNLWERRPQKDLFMGNRTSCCTALGNGTNGKSTPIYLLNTAFNVAQLKDKNGNIVAMSRIHAAKSDGKPCILMDNIEINSALLKKMDLDDIQALRDKFFEYITGFAKEIAPRKKPKVYFSASYVNVPMLEYRKTEKTLDFIGELTSEQFYSNAAKKWIKPEELKETEVPLYEIG